MKRQSPPYRPRVCSFGPGMDQVYTLVAGLLEDDGRLHKEELVKAHGGGATERAILKPCHWRTLTLIVTLIAYPEALPWGNPGPLLVDYRVFEKMDTGHDNTVSLDEWKVQLVLPSRYGSSIYTLTRFRTRRGS